MQEQAQNLAHAVSIFKLSSDGGLGRVAQQRAAPAVHAAPKPVVKPASKRAVAAPAPRAPAAPKKLASAAPGDDWEEF